MLYIDDLFIRNCFEKNNSSLEPLNWDHPWHCSILNSDVNFVNSIGVNGADCMIIRGDGIQRLLMEGRINGRRGRGRPRTMWTDNIKEWTKMSYNDCIRVAQDRERWRSMTADLLTTDGT